MSNCILFDADNTLVYITPYRRLLGELNRIDIDGKRNKGTIRELELNIKFVREFKHLLFKPYIIDTLTLMQDNKEELNIGEINIFTRNTSTTIFDAICTVLEEDYQFKFNKLIQPSPQKSGGASQQDSDLIKAYIPVAQRVLSGELYPECFSNIYGGSDPENTDDFRLLLFKEKGDEGNFKSVPNYIDVCDKQGLNLRNFILFDDDMNHVAINNSDPTNLFKTGSDRIILKSVFKYWGVKTFQLPKVHTMISNFLTQNGITIKQATTAMNKWGSEVKQWKSERMRTEAYMCEKPRDYLDILNWSYLKEKPPPPPSPPPSPPPQANISARGGRKKKTTIKKYKKNKKRRKTKKRRC